MRHRELERWLERAIEELSEALVELAQGVEGHFERIDCKLRDLEERLERLESLFS
jgi:uncharacterized coiled-coil protein SlyX